MSDQTQLEREGLGLPGTWVRGATVLDLATQVAAICARALAIAEPGSSERQFAAERVHRVTGEMSGRWIDNDRRAARQDELLEEARDSLRILAPLVVTAKADGTSFRFEEALAKLLRTIRTLRRRDGTAPVETDLEILKAMFILRGVTMEADADTDGQPTFHTLYVGDPGGERVCFAFTDEGTFHDCYTVE